MKDYSELVQQVIDGQEDPILAYAEIKKQLDFLTKCKEQIEDHAKEEAAKFGKSFEYKGFKIEVREGGRQWNFKGIGEWQTYSKALKDCEERAKAAYSSYEKGLNTCDENGEEVALPEVTFRKPSLVIKELKK